MRSLKVPIVSSEGCKIIDSGVLVPLTNQSGIVFLPGLGNIEFRFEPAGEVRIDVKAVPGGATVTISGYENATLGAGLLEPLDFATLSGKQVLLNLKWYNVGGSGPYLIYAFYQRP